MAIFSIYKEKIMNKFSEKISYFSFVGAASLIAVARFYFQQRQ